MRVAPLRQPGVDVVLPQRPLGLLRDEILHRQVAEQLHAIAPFAGHRSTEPAQQLALAKLGLEPVLDLGMRLGEGTGALTALPVLRSAVLLLREMALLADLAGPG